MCNRPIPYTVATQTQEVATPLSSERSAEASQDRFSTSVCRPTGLSLLYPKNGPSTKSQSLLTQLFSCALCLSTNTSQVILFVRTHNLALSQCTELLLLSLFLCLWTPFHSCLKYQLEIHTDPKFLQFLQLNYVRIVLQLGTKFTLQIPPVLHRHTYNIQILCCNIQGFHYKTSILATIVLVSVINLICLKSFPLYLRLVLHAVSRFCGCCCCGICTSAWFLSPCLWVHLIGSFIEESY